MTTPLAKSAVTLTINGKATTVEVAPWTSLLDLLREYLDLTGTKKGCDHGQCGSVHGTRGRQARELLPDARHHEGWL